MAEIDSLEISIQSRIDSVNKNLDALIGKLGVVAKGISAIGSNKGLLDFAKEAKTISEGMGSMGTKMEQSMKPMEDETKKIAKTFEQIKDPFKDLGKGFRISGNITDVQKAIQKYENELEKAKLKEQTLLAKGSVNTKGYENAIADIAKYENIIESLKNQFKELSQEKVVLPEPVDYSKYGETAEHLASVGAFETLNEYIKDLENSTNKATESAREFKNVWNGIKLPNIIEVKDLGVKEFTERARNQIEQSLAGVKIENPISIGDMSDEQFQIFQRIKEEIESTEPKLEDFKQSLKDFSKIIDFGGQETESGMIIPIAGLEQSLSELKRMYPEVEELISSYEAEIDRARELTAGGAKTQKFGNIDLNQFDVAKEKTKEFESALDSLKNIQPKINETNLTKLQNKLKSVEEQTEKLRYDLEKGLRFGTISDKQFDNLKIKIRESENTADALRAKIAEVGSGSASKNAENLSSVFAKISKSGKTLSASLSGLVKKLKSFANGVRNVVSRIGKLIKSIFTLNTATKKSSGGFNLGLKTILKYGFGIRSLYVLVNKLRSAIKEGMKNLVQYSSETNASISMLASSLATFKNASAAAVSPLLNALAPALNQIIQLCIKAVNAINQLLSSLFGKGTWIKAKDQIIDWGDSVKDAADAAKGALQPFDKLNNLTTQKASSGGMEPGDMFETLPIKDKFKDLADWLKDMWDKADFYDLGKMLGEKLKEALDSIPWDYIKEWARKLAHMLATFINGFIEVEGLGYSIGKTLAEAINTAYEFLNEFVHTLHWESVGHFIADTLNGFFENIDWELIRDTFITGFKGLADAINQFISDFHWNNISNTISNAINIIAETVYTFFSTVNWDELGKNLGNQLMETIRKIDWEMMGRAIGSVLQSAFDFIKSFVSQLDLSDIAQAMSDLLKGVFSEVDTGDLAIAITALLGASLAKISFKALTSKIKMDSFSNSLAKAFGMSGASSGASFLSGLSGTPKSLGGFGGLLTTDLATIFGAGTITEIGLTIGATLIGGIAGALGGGAIGKLLDNYILSPLFSFDEELSEQYKNFKWFGEDGFLSQFKESITDGSWKEALRLWGQDINDGLDALFGIETEPLWTILEDAKEQLRLFGEFVKEDWNNSYVGQMISSFKDGSWKEALSLWGEDLKADIKSVGEFIKDDWNNSYIGQMIASFTDGSWKNALELWGQDIQNAFITLGERISEKWEEIKSSITGKLSEIKEGISEKMKSIKENWNNAWSSMKDKVSNIIQSIKSVISSAVSWISGQINAIKSAISGLSTSARSMTSGSFGSFIGSNIKKPGSIKVAQYAAGGFPEDGWFRASKGEYFGQFDDGTSYIGTNKQIENGVAIGVEQAAYRGMTRALRESGGMAGGSSVNITLEGEAAELFRVYRTEYLSEAKRKGIATLDPVMA